MKSDRTLAKVRRRVERCQRRTSGKYVQGDGPAAEADRLLAGIFQTTSGGRSRPELVDTIVVLSWFYRWRLQDAGHAEDVERFEVLSAVAFMMAPDAAPSDEDIPAGRGPIRELMVDEAWKRLDALGKAARLATTTPQNLGGSPEEGHIPDAET